MGFVPQRVYSSLVQLTVSNGTKLSLEMRRNGNVHTVQRWLKHESSGIHDKTVKIKINQTEYQVQTNGTGFFARVFDLKPIDNEQITYEIKLAVR
jgi:hypothetical protein